MIGLLGVCVVGDRVQVLALLCSTPLGCKGSTLFSCLLVRAWGILGMGGGPAACALVELAPLLCHCLGRSRSLNFLGGQKIYRAHAIRTSVTSEHHIGGCRALSPGSL
jgi:hypothetical protein